MIGLSVLVPADDSPREGKDLALFIAIDQYDNWQKLRNPVRDAKEVAKELKKQYGFETEILRNPTELEIFKKLNEYMQKYYEQDNQLLIFFSGHGHLIRSSREGFIIPRDAYSLEEDPFGSSFIPHDRLRNIVASIPCEHVLLIMDSCFSGTFDQRIVRGGESANALDGVKKLNESEFEARTLLYLTAGGDEYVDDGETHSPFARAFLLGLRDFADFNNDGIITFPELSGYIQSTVVGQKPTAGDFKEHEGGGFYFINADRINSEGKAGENSGRNRGEVSYTTIPLTSNGALTLSPDWSPDGAWIVYSSNLETDMDIWKQPTNGGEAIPLTSMSGDESSPSWSPDGEWIAFGSGNEENGGLMLMRADGSELRQLVPFGGTPDWSADGKRLVFESKGNVYTVALENGEPELLVQGTSSNPHPVWAGNDNYILYWNRTLGGIYKIEVATKNTQRLKLVPAGQEIQSINFNRESGRLLYSLGPFGGSKNLYGVSLDSLDAQPDDKPYNINITTTDDIEGVFSPDAQRVAFISRSVERHLHSIPLDSTTGLATGEPKKLTRLGKMNYYPSLASDGKSLIWTSHRSGQGNLYMRELDSPNSRGTKVTEEWNPDVREISGSFDPVSGQVVYASTLNGSYRLWQMKEMGGKAKPITKTKNPMRDVHPNLSTDGKALVFCSNRSGNWDIWLMNDLDQANNSNALPLTNWPGNEMYPYWSPDRKWIAFQADLNGNTDIWVMPGEGGEAKPLITHPAEETWSAWSPNGKWFYFVSNREGRHNIWRMPSDGGTAAPVTSFQQADFGLPETNIYTKFAVSNDRLILSLEERKGDVYLLQ